MCKSDTSEWYFRYFHISISFYFSIGLLPMDFSHTNIQTNFCWYGWRSAIGWKVFDKFFVLVFDWSVSILILVNAWHSPLRTLLRIPSSTETAYFLPVCLSASLSVCLPAFVLSVCVSLGAWLSVWRNGTNVNLQTAFFVATVGTQN
jgi:hypothetical protein